VNGRPLALTLGDPAGVGPEIAVKAWQALRDGGPPFLVVGDFQALACASAAGASILRRVTRAEDATGLFADALPVLDLPLRADVVAGQPSPLAATSIIRWIETAVGLALSEAVAGVVTAPIAKAPLYAAGFKFPGHTEFLGELTAAVPQDGARGPVMMLTAADLRVSLVTVHKPLAQVSAALSLDAIVKTALVTAQALRRDFGIEAPRLAVAGLNPHAGEDGTLGGPGAPGPGDRRHGPLPRRLSLSRGDADPVRRGDLPLSRPGAHPGEDARLLGWGERDAGPAHSANLAGPRCRL